MGVFDFQYLEQREIMSAGEEDFAAKMQKIHSQIKG
jgi:hypothetical protein